MSNHPIVGDGPFTVGELLVDAERTARRLLGRPSTADGTSLLAGWDVVLAAASEVLAAQTTASATPAVGDAVGLVSGLVAQLAEEAQAVAVAQVPSRLHPDIVRVTLTWRQAAAASEQSPKSRRDTPDLVALRTIRTLTVVAHATQLALGGDGPGVAGLDADEAQGFRRLLQRHEQLALRSLRALTADDSPPITKESASVSAPQLGNVVPSSSEIDRLSDCLNQWGPLSFAAAADPTSSARDLSRIAHVAAITTAGAAALVAAAGQRQELPNEAVPHLQRRLAAASQHWRQVAGQWEWIHRLRAPDPSEQVHSAAQALTAAILDPHRGVRADQRASSSSDPGSAPSAGADLLPVLQKITENSAILAEIYARLPARTHRCDNAGQLRPVLYAPKRVLHQIANETQARDHAQLRPGAQVSAVVLAAPVTSYRVDQLRPLTHDAVTFLRAGGADLARAATAAEQALDAVGVSSPQPTRPATSTTAPAHPNPAPPHMPGSVSRGTTPDTGIPR